MEEGTQGRNPRPSGPLPASPSASRQPGLFLTSEAYVCCSLTWNVFLVLSLDPPTLMSDPPKSEEALPG